MEIITSRFLLREFTSEDEPAFLAYHADLGYAEFWEPEEVKPDHTKEIIRLFIQWAHEQPSRNYQFAVVPFRNPKKLLGCCGLRGEGYGSDSLELGIELAPKYWGRYRYAIEVVGALLEFGFGELDLQEVRGFSMSANARVTRLAQRRCRLWGWLKWGEGRTRTSSSVGASELSSAALPWTLE